MNFFRSAFGILQKIGKSLMLPVSVLPAAGILLGVGSAKFAALPPLMSSVMAQAGGAIFGNLPLIFAVSVALGLTAGDGSAALAGVVGFAVLVATMGVMAPVVGYEPVQILGMPSIETGVFGGLVIGAVVGFLHQRYSRTKLPTWLGFFSGSRLIPILTAFAAVVTGIVMAYIWPPIGEQIARFSHWAAEGSPATAFGLYGLVERALIPFGLHHIWNAPFFFEVGSYLDPATGNVIKGEIYRFTAGDPTAGNLAGGYLFKMWGLPAAAIAIWHTAKPENRAKVGGIMISAAMTSFLTGITEPIEFSFLFVAPLLYGIHAVLAGAAYVIAVKLGIHHSTTFSHGLIDFVVLYPNAQRGWWLLWLGPLYALLYYTIFRALIVARDLKTPGREDDDAPSALGAAVAGVKAGIATANASMAAKLVAAFGGAPNIKSLDACITRLRVELHDVSRGSVEALKALGATGVLTVGGGMQAIFGTRSEGLKNEMADYIAAGGTGAEVMLSAPSRDLLLAALGGADNVIGAAAVAHTRVRVQVRDDAAVDTGALERAGASGVQRVGKGVVHLIVGTDAAAWATTLGARTLAALALMVAVATSTLHAQRPLFISPEYEITSTGVRQSRFEAQALGRDTIVSTYPRAAREVHFKFALNGRDNEFPPGIEHTINLRPRGGEVVTPLYAFAVEPRPQLPRPEDANEGENGNARVTIRLDLRQVKRALTQRGWYKPPQGDTIRALARVTVIGDTDPLVWDVNAVSVGAPQDLTDADRDGIYEVTLPFRTEYLRPLDADGRAIWVRSADLSAFPELRSPDPLLDALYRLSLEELTQLMRDDGALAAGAKWPGVWTRDVALSSLLSLAIVVPEAVRISLMKKVDATGRIIQDTGTGGSWPISTDRMTWALAAWEVYAVTGDREWLRAAYAIIRRSAEADAHAALDVESGLLRGESSFLDWREQSYPRWMQPADIYQSLALGTNAVHYGAYEILHRMGMALGAPAGELNAWQMRAEGIRTGLATELWLPSLDRHAQFSYGRVSRARSPRYEALGESLAALTGAATAEHAARALAAAPRVPFGTPTFWPFIEGVPFYHNATIWPFVTAYDTWAAADARSMHPVERGLASVTRGTALFLTNKENLVAETGHFEGTALNSDRQLWSVAGALAMQYRVLFGLRFEVDRLRFAPVVPESYVGERELRGIKYRGATLTVRVRGWGACAAPAAVLDGVPITRAEIPATLTGAHLIEITLGESCHVTSGISGSSGSSGTSGSSALVATRFAPATPMAQVAGEGVRRVLQWDSIPGAAQYVVHRDGRPIDTLRVRALSVIAHDSLAEYQLEAIDELGTGSFLSEPQRVVTVMGVQEFVPRSAQRNLERASAPVAFRVRIATTGRYAVDALYSNGNGPINTEDKAAVRTLDVDGRESGVLVMPQRGAGAWELRGYSNPVLVTLPAGEHIFTVRWDARDENMNGAVSRALLHQLRITRLPNAR